METKNKPEPENFDFPEPIFDDEIDVGWDILTYLHKAAEYEKWAERGSRCTKSGGMTNIGWVITTVNMSGKQEIYEEANKRHVRLINGNE